MTQLIVDSILSQGNLRGAGPSALEWARERIYSVIALAREEGRQEERKRCAAIARTFGHSWGKNVAVEIERLNTPSQEQTNDPEAPH